MNTKFTLFLVFVLVVIFACVGECSNIRDQTHKLMRKVIGNSASSNTTTDYMTPSLTTLAVIVVCAISILTYFE